MTIERDIGSLLLGVGRIDLQPSEVQGLLLRIAKLVSAAPAMVTGPGPTVCWRLGERGFTIEVIGRAHGSELVFTTFDWQERDRQAFQLFKWSDGVEVPFWWSLPIAAGHGWYADTVVSNWASFFTCFRACWNDLPGELALLPAAWIRPGNVVISRWTVEGAWTGQLAVAVSVTGVSLTGVGTPAFELRVPAERLRGRGVDVPAVVAGLTSGTFTDLGFVGNETVMEMFPVGGAAAADDDDEDDDDGGDQGSSSDAPEAVMTVAAVEARLAAPVVARADRASSASAPSVGAVEPGKSFVPVLGAADAVKLARLLLQRNEKAPNIVALYDAALAKAGAAPLTVRLRPRRSRTGPIHAVWVCLGRSDAGVSDLTRALGYGNQVRDHLTEQVGAPATLRVGTSGTVSRLWRVGDAGLVVRVEPSQVSIEIDESDLLYLGQLALL